jgi:small-conductance mechanosensitive channel
VLSAIIFLFIKHPYDVGDRVSLDDVYYTVKEIRLLSTIFVDENGASVQAPNAQITTKFILNVRRSGQMSEPFAFDVAFGTTFEQLEELRGKMVAWLVHEKRDYLPSFDLAVVGQWSLLSISPALFCGCADGSLR